MKYGISRTFYIFGQNLTYGSTKSLSQCVLFCWSTRQLTLGVNRHASEELRYMVCIIPQLFCMKQTSFNPKIQFWRFTELELTKTNILHQYWSALRFRCHIYDLPCDPGRSATSHWSFEYILTITYAIHATELSGPTFPMKSYILTIPRTWEIETKSFKLW